MPDRVISIGLPRSGHADDRPWLADAGGAELQAGIVQVLVPAGVPVEQMTGALQHIIWAAKRDPNIYRGD